MASELIQLILTANVQIAASGKAEVSMSTDSSWETKDDLLQNGALVYSLQGISVLLNEVSETTGFVEKQLTYLSSEDESLLSRISISEPDVVSGKQYLIKLRYKFVNTSDSTIKYGETNTISMYIKSVPVKPQGITNTIRPDDAGLSINISQIYVRLSENDGFDQIQKIRYYISKVNGKEAEDLISGTIDLDLENNVRVYNKWYSITQLSNGAKYEVAYRVVNSMGESLLSDTIQITPSDLPAQITAVAAVNNFNDDLVSKTNVADTSTLKVYWAKPSDYDALVSGLKPVTKYTIKKFRVVYNADSGDYDVCGNAVTTELDHDSNETPIYQLANPIDYEGKNYHYVYSFDLNSDDYGKIFYFTVFATNANGSGPDSSPSDNVASYINPEVQEFTLNHQTESVSTLGGPIQKYNGKLDMVIDTLSQLNGLTDGQTSEEVSNVVDSDGVTNFEIKSVGLVLTVTNEETSAQMFTGDVTFKQQYTTQDQVFNGLTKTVGTLTDKWEVKDITSLNGFQSLVDGKKYRFTLNRKGTDPLDNTLNLVSVNHDIIRTQFKSPEKVKFLQAYSIDDDYVPVKINGQSGIRVRFKQISLADMNGTDVFIEGENTLEYELRANSLPIEGVERIDHDSDNPDAVREFFAPSNIGTTTNLYIRIYIRNTELDVTVVGAESSPQVSEKAITYPNAVTNLKSDVNESGNSVTVTWTKQEFTGIGGFSNSNVYNKVYLYNDTTNSLFAAHEVAYGETQSKTFENLDLGNVYKIYVVSYGKYTRANVLPEDDTAETFTYTNKYENAIIRGNYKAAAISAVGSLGKPTNVEAYPSENSVTFNYDTVAETELGGNDPENLVYHFILNSDDTYFPYVDEAGTVLQSSVSNVSGTKSAIIYSGYESVNDASNSALKTDLENGKLYNYAIYAVSNIGGEPINNTEENLNEENATNITLESVISTPEETIMGDVFVGDSKIIINNNVPTPEVSVTAGQGIIVLSIKKPPTPPSELVVVLDDNDALDKDGNSVPVFSTIDIRKFREDQGDGSVTGLFYLENADAETKNDINGVNYGSEGYNFSVSTNTEGVTYYSLTIKNLVNGRIHDVQVRFANTIQGYDYFGPMEQIEIAAEAPPTEPRDAVFAVDDRQIDLSWNEPLNSGGANIGSNGPLLYSIEVTTGGNIVLTVPKISTEYYTLNATTFPNITNNVIYSISIKAYYTKNTSNVVGNAVTIQSIKPNQKPLSPSVTTVPGSNKISVTITTPSASQSTMYPLSSIDVYIKKSNELAYPENPSKSFNVDDDSINDGTQSLSTDILNLLNGENYDVKVKCVANYTYAQAPTDVLKTNQTPFGAPVVNASDAAPVIGNNKALNLTVSLNGSGSISQVVALGKSSASSAIGILNLSGIDLPTITTSGTETGLVAANQTASFKLDFGSTISSNLSDAIIVVNTTKGTDAGAYSTANSGSQYFVDNL